MSIHKATIIDGPFKGWPVGAAMLFTQGHTPKDIKAHMKADIDKTIKSLEAMKADIDRLPDVFQVGDAG